MCSVCLNGGTAVGVVTIRGIWESSPPYGSGLHMHQGLSVDAHLRPMLHMYPALLCVVPRLPILCIPQTQGQGKKKMHVLKCCERHLQIWFSKRHFTMLCIPRRRMSVQIHFHLRIQSVYTFSRKKRQSFVLSAHSTVANILRYSWTTPPNAASMLWEGFASIHLAAA